MLLHALLSLLNVCAFMRDLSEVANEPIKMRVLFSIALLTLLPAARGSNLSSVPCPTNTVAYYEANFSSSTVGSPDGPCAAGILNFSRFTFNSSGSPVSDLLGNDQIFLSPEAPPLGDDGDTGFSISGMSVAAGQTATYVIDWYFEIDGGPVASGADLGMDPPFGNVTITQDYCVDSFMTAYVAGNAALCYNLGTAPPIQFLTVTTNAPNASIVFHPPAFDFASVRTIVELTGGTTGAGFDSVTGRSSIAPAPAPEPRTILLIPGALLILFALRRSTLKQ